MTLPLWASIGLVAVGALSGWLGFRILDRRAPTPYWKAFIANRFTTLLAILMLVWDVHKKSWGWVIYWTAMLVVDVWQAIRIDRMEGSPYADRQGVPGNHPGAGNLTFSSATGTVSISGAVITSTLTPTTPRSYTGPAWARPLPDSIPESERADSSGIAQPPTFVGAHLYGYRAFSLEPGQEGPKLVSVSVVSPGWDTSTYKAVCMIHRDASATALAVRKNITSVLGPHPDRDIPAESCTCGLYAMWDPEPVAPSTVVYGLVEASGKVIPADYGWRAAQQELLGLFVPKRRGLLARWAVVRELKRRYGVPVFVKWGRFVKWAEERTSDG